MKALCCGIFFINLFILFPLQSYCSPKIGNKLLSRKVSYSVKKSGVRILSSTNLQRAEKTLNPKISAALAKKIHQQHPPQTDAQRGRLFQAVSTQDSRIKFSGVVFYTYYQGQKEIYGAMPAHAIASSSVGVPGIERRFEAIFFLPDKKIKKIPAEIVAYSPASMMDVVLIKFPKEAESFLNPYPLGTLHHDKKVYSLGYNKDGLLPVYNRQVLQALPYSIRTSMPLADKNTRQGLCGSAVLNHKAQLIGIHTGSSVKEDPQTKQPVCSYAAPASFLNRLVEAYHNGGNAAVPFYIDSQRFINLNIDEYIISYSLLNEVGSSLITKPVNFHLSRSILNQQLQEFPQAKFLLITTHRLSWDVNNHALPVFLLYEETPKTVYLYNLRTQKQYKLPKFLHSLINYHIE